MKLMCNKNKNTQTDLEREERERKRGLSYKICQLV